MKAKTDTRLFDAYTAYGYANFTHLITRIHLEEKGAIIKEKASSWYIAA